MEPPSRTAPARLVTLLTHGLQSDINAAWRLDTDTRYQYRDGMTTTGGPPTYRALVRVPGVARILLSLAVGRIAASMAAVTMVVFALERFDSPALAGLVVFASTVPAVIMAPIAGALLDRHGRVRLVILDQLIGGGALLAVAALAAADQLPAWLLVAIASIASFTRPLSLTGLRTTLPMLVPAPLWPRVNALDSNAFVLATLLGPAMAGVILASLGGVAALTVVGLLLALAALPLLGVPEPPVGARSGRPLLADAWQGVRYTWHNATLRGLAIAMACYYAGMGALTVTVPVLLLDTVGTGPEAVGLAWSAMAIAGGGAAFVAGARTRIGGERRWLAWAMASTVAGAALLLGPASIGLVIAALLVIGAMQGPIDIAMFTLRQRRTHPDWFGRAFSVSVALNSAGSPIAAAFAGVLLATSPAAAVLLAVGLFTAGAILTRLVPATDPAVVPSGAAVRKVA
jgi:MFS family permease